MGRIDAMTEGRLMHLIFPEGADVHVTIGNPPNLTVPGAVVAAPASPRYSDAYPRHSGRPLLKGLVAMMVLGGHIRGGHLCRPAASGRRPARCPCRAGCVTGPPAPGTLPSAARGERSFPGPPAPRETPPAPGRSRSSSPSSSASRRPSSRRPGRPPLPRRVASRARTPFGLED